MSFLSLFRKDDVAVARELSDDERALQDELQQYTTSFARKQEVLQHLLDGEPIGLHLQQLSLALADELAVVKESERKEKEILHDLKYISREAYVKHIEELAEHLNAAEQSDRYGQALMEELHELLQAEAHKVKRLLEGETDPAIAQSIIDLLLMEGHLVEKLGLIEDDRRLFQELFLGTQRRNAVDSIQGRFVQNIYKQMMSIAVDADGTVQSANGHYLSQLTADIFNKLEQAVMEAVRDGQIEDHEFVDMEFVNGPLFEQFVRMEVEADKLLGKLVPSTRTLAAFVLLFREMYNAQVANAPKVVS